MAASDTTDIPKKVVSVWLLAVGYLIFFVGTTVVLDAFWARRLMELAGFQGDAQSWQSQWSQSWRKIAFQLLKIRVGLALLVFGIFVAVNLGFIYTLYMHGTNALLAFKIVSLSFVGMVGVMFVLSNDTFFIKVFENTVGYFVLDMMGRIAPVMDAMVTLKNNDDALWQDYRFLLSVFRLDNFGDMFQTFSGKSASWSFSLSDNRDSVEKLFRLVLQKHFMGHMCWIYLATLTASVVASKLLAIS